MKLSALTFITVLTTTSAGLANNTHFGDGSPPNIYPNTYIASKTASYTHYQQKTNEAVQRRTQFDNNNHDESNTATAATRGHKNTVSNDPYKHSVYKWR